MNFMMPVKASRPWYLYRMVTQTMLRTHEEKLMKKYPIGDRLDLLKCLREAAKKYF